MASIGSIFADAKLLGVAVGKVIGSEAKSAVDAASTAYADALGVELGITRLGNTNADIPIDHKVILEYYVGSASTVKIEALLPQNFNLDLRANWSQKDAMGLKDLLSAKNMASAGAALNRYGSTARTSRTGKVIGAAARMGGKLVNNVGGGAAAAADYLGLSNTTAKFMTAHYWQGASPISCNIPFEFIAEDDPDSQVLTPIKELYKLAAPYEEGGIIIPPGPSIAGVLSSVGIRINIYLGRILAFENVIIESVAAEIDTRPAKGTGANKGKILHAKVDVSFTSFYTATRDDIDKMFARNYTG
jgi:hypothetical protein